MSHYHNYILAAEKIIASFKGDVPLQHHLKEYFKANKKHGSKDRRYIRSLCYSYYRAAHAFQHESLSNKLWKAAYLCNALPANAFDESLPDISNNSDDSLTAKLTALQVTPQQLFPCYYLLSDGIDKDAYVTSLLLQPDLFLRIRPDKEKWVTTVLQENNVPYSIEGNAVRLANGTQLPEALKPNRDYVVQDLSSQHTLDYFSKAFFPVTVSVWDCCAASGGKAILIKDILKNIYLDVSDIRPTIIHNLKQRLEQARIPVNNCLVLNAANPIPDYMHKAYDIVICDAPCTGSGTWSRNPEELFYFTMDKATAYTEKQEKITTQILASIRPGGYLAYITCSVFTMENERIAEKLTQQGLELVHQEYITGYHHKADNLFVSIFRK